MSNTTRVTLSTTASRAIRALIDQIVENGLRSQPEQFRQQLARLDSQNASDPSNVALALMLAGAEAMGIDLVKLGELKVAALPERDEPKPAEEEGT